MNRLVHDRKQNRATMIQKYLRGHVSRLQTLEVLKEVHLGSHLEYFAEMRRTVLDDFQIRVAYAWKRYKKRKAAKKAAKLKAQEEAKAKKYGRNYGRRTTVRK